MDPLHATAISFSGMGCLILGDSGTGKSRLAADALMLGAKLIADDRVRLMSNNGFVVAASVPELAGVLEMRGFGLIRLHENQLVSPHNLHLVVALDAQSDTRLPELETQTFFGIELPFLRLPPVPRSSASALLLYLHSMQSGRVLPTDWIPKRTNRE